MPVNLEVEGDAFSARRSSGGLASALQGVAGDAPFLWVGWPGCEVPAALQPQVTEWLAADDLVPVYLDAREEELYYHGISNHVLWPLFHYFADKVEFEHDAWDVFVEINRRFAERILEVAPPGARVWVHDFHLMLVPGLLRELDPERDLEIGFFLHIPFPSSEIIRLLPAREELLTGVLGADYVAFHTHDYARHFRASCLRSLGIDSSHDELEIAGRRVGLGVHPIGIDLGGFEAALTCDQSDRYLRELHERYAGKKVILGVERLDYTKGVPLKLRAFERLLERRPDLRDEVVLLQLIVPSRLDNPQYAQLRSEIEERVGRLNGKLGGPGRTPIEYLHRSVPIEQLVALYRFADVCLITAIRDGMNLVAQEFVLCQEERESLGDAHRGVLVLSEFAGAAQVLARAMLVNPWDVEATVDVLEEALTMEHEEKVERGRSMAVQVRGLEVTKWAAKFLARARQAADRRRERQHATQSLTPRAQGQLRARFAEADRRVLFLDYDGTLRELVRTPEEAKPTPEILGLLRDLSADPATEVHIVSGRHRRDLEEWFGDLPIRLSAEHGFTTRAPGGTWASRPDVDLTWMPLVEETFSGVCDEVPGTRVELKPNGLAWHYRMADLDYGTWRARQLHSQLEDDLAHQPVDILHGHRVIEVRAAGISKGGYVAGVLADRGVPDFVLCIGDDRTDRDMYEALPKDAVTVHVGGGADTEWSVESPARVRAFLTDLASTTSRATE